MSAGRPLEPAGNGRPRWMAAAGANPSGYAPRTESGVQVDSSVAHQLRASIMTLSWSFIWCRWLTLAIVGVAFDGLATA